MSKVESPKMINDKPFQRTPTDNTAFLDSILVEKKVDGVTNDH